MGKAFAKGINELDKIIKKSKFEDKGKYLERHKEEPHELTGKAEIGVV